MEDTIYQYKDVPITPGIILELILEIYSGKTVERKVIVRGIEIEHIKRGGIKSDTVLTTAIKKALSNMQKSGLASSIGNGYWRFAGTSEIDDTNVDMIEDEVSDLVDESEESLHVDIEFGEGAEAIYVYYLPVYKEHALSNGETTWQCKTGRTAGDPSNRILSQASAALPEKPHVALLFRMNSSREYELAIHNILKIRGGHIYSAPGVEWFDTCPLDVKKIILQISSGEIV